MFARVTTLQGPAERAEDGIGAFESLVPTMRQMEGWERAYLLVNRETGKAMSVTVWDTREALDATAAAAEQMRTQAAQVFGGSVEAVESYEVVTEVSKDD